MGQATSIDFHKPERGPEHQLHDPLTRPQIAPDSTKNTAMTAAEPSSARTQRRGFARKGFLRAGRQGRAAQGGAGTEGRG
jgi:hypothetical protein